VKLSYSIVTQTASDNVSRTRHPAARIAPVRIELGRIFPVNANVRMPKELTRSDYSLLGCRWWKVIPML